MAFTNLAHHIDIDWLLKAYAQTRKDGAVGVDGQTADEYEVNLMGNLQDLLDRAKSGTYVAPPVRRVHIPKAGSPDETRPLGIPTFEDKILQRAVLMVLEPVYETDFLDVSHGFRPGRGAHGALDSLWKQAMKHGRRLDRGRRSSKILRHDRPWPSTGVPQASGARWCDPAPDRQMAQRWGAGRRGPSRPPKHGTPQGGVISPLLANIFLHYVLDEWFEQEVRPRLKGEAFLIRYADDFVIGVAREDDARRIMDVLPKRMSKYGLTVHPEKTRLVRFHPADADDSDTTERTPTAPRTFDFLGFTHYWGRSRQGGWVVKRKTAKGRLKRALQALSEWCRENRHRPIAEQHQKLKQKLQGHYGVLRDHRQLLQPPELPGGDAGRIWRRWLSRRRRGGRCRGRTSSAWSSGTVSRRPRVVHGLLSRAAKS